MEGRGPDPRPFEPHGNGPAPPGPPFRTGGAVLSARHLLSLSRLDAAPGRRELPVPDPGRRSAHPDAAHGRSVGGRRSAGVAADVRGRRRRARRCAGARGHLGPGAPPPLPDRPGAAPPAHSVRNRAALAIHPGRLVFPGPLRRRVSQARSEEHTSELQSQSNIVCRLLLEERKYTEPTWASFPTTTSTCFPNSIFAAPQPISSASCRASYTSTSPYHPTLRPQVPPLATLTH